MKLGEFQGKVYFFHRRRLRCKECAHTFQEQNPIILKRGNRSLNKLRRVRSEQGLTQGVVAKAAEIPFYLYQSYELVEDPAIPDLSEAGRIAATLQVNIEDIWDLKDVEHATLQNERERLQKEEERQSKKLIHMFVAGFKTLSKTQRSIVIDKLRCLNN